jgi:hypothetical protein
MRRSLLLGSLLSSLLVLSLTLLGYADKTQQPSTQRIVLTVVALDPKTHTATMRADEDGTAFQTMNSASWKSGAKVLCDLVESATRGRQLQNCQQW